MFGLNLLGDPETRLWTDTPAEMELVFNPVLATGPQTFTVEVTSEETPVAEALVCLSKGEDVYCVEESDSQGRVQILIAPDETGTLHVTATKRDHVPAIGEAQVVSDLPPAQPEAVFAEEVIGPAALLIWSPACDADLAGYNIYRNTVEVPQPLTSVAEDETTYCDTTVVEGMTYYYWVSSVDSVGLESSLSEPCSVIVSGALAIPTEPRVGSVISIEPNPFAGTVQFFVWGRSRMHAEADIFDVKGRWVRGVGLAEDGTGLRRGSWDAKTQAGIPLSPGIYIVRFKVDDETSTHKLILLR
jgi:hypothetical protein